jgi:hypothetical protein
MKKLYYEKAIEILEAKAKEYLFESKDLESTFETGYRIMEAVSVLKNATAPEGYLGLNDPDNYTIEDREESPELKFAKTKLEHSPEGIKKID